MPKNWGLGQFANLRQGAWQERGGVVSPQACYKIKDVDSTEFFKKMKLATLPLPPKKKVLLKLSVENSSWIFKNCQEYINIKTKSLMILWGVQFSKVWSLQPPTLLLAYSFIKNELLNSAVQVFYVLFRSKHWTSGGCSHYC